MTQFEQKKLFTRQDILLLTILLFLVTILLVGYEAYRKGNQETQDVSVEIPPVVVTDLDVKIFETLRTKK